jgi:hypothetical protein
MGYIGPMSTLLLLLTGCASETVTFSMSPQPLAFGAVDFPPEMPDGGYAVEMLSVTNTGDTTGSLTLPEPDPDIFCIAGFPEGSFPATLGEVGPGSTYILNVGLCGYPPGESGNLQQLSFDIETDGDPAILTVEVEFTPNRVTE